MEKRTLEDFLGKILRREVKEENEFVRELLKSIANDLGSSTSEYIKKENTEVVKERLNEANLNVTEVDDSIKVFNIERIINNAKRNGLLAKYVTEDPYELGLDLAEKLYLNTPDRILFNDLILRDINNLIKSIEEYGDQTIDVSEIENVYLNYLLAGKDSKDLSELDKTVLDAYRKIYSYTKSANLERDNKPITEVYKEIEDAFDNSVNAKDCSEEVLRFHKECMKIQHKIRTRLIKDNISDSVTILEVLKDVPLVDKCYINTLFAIELRIAKDYFDSLDKEGQERYLSVLEDSGELYEK